MRVIALPSNPRSQTVVQQFGMFLLRRPVPVEQRSQPRERQVTEDRPDGYKDDYVRGMSTPRVIVGRYRLVGPPLGRGGMGVVWRAYDEDLHREVALKELTLPAGLDEKEGAVWRRRFQREAQAAARLQHQSIVAVHDIVRDDDRAWIVMQLIEGRSLAQAVTVDGPRPLGEAFRLGLTLADALAAAHGEGVIHRDVTPRNVLLADDGKAYLGDFGIASVAGVTGVTDTDTGAVLGTYGYIAPERLQGSAPDSRSDLWSLGATLYYAVEGRPAFGATEPAALITATPTRAPSAAKLAGPLAPLLRLLARDPTRRPPTAVVVRDEIAALVATHEGTTVPVAGHELMAATQEMPEDGGVRLGRTVRQSGTTATELLQPWGQGVRAALKEIYDASRALYAQAKDRIGVDGSPRPPSPAAPAADRGGGNPQPAKQAPLPRGKTFDVILLDAGHQPSVVPWVIQRLTRQDIKRCRKVVRRAPGPVVRNVDRAEAPKMIEIFERVGATVTLSRTARFR